MDQRAIQPVQSEQWADPASKPKIVIQFSYGLNENINPNEQECTEGYNFDLSFSDYSFRPRLPFKLMGTAPNAGKVSGMVQLIKRDGTETTVIVAGTVAYSWDGVSTFTNVGSVTGTALMRGAYWSLGDYSVIADLNLNNVVKKWDGTTWSNLTTTGAATFKAKYVIVHQNRVWWFNCSVGGVSLPHMIVVSKFEDPTNYDTTTRGGPTTVGGGSFSVGTEAFYLLTQDLRPINGVCLFQQNLIISTDKGRTWALTGTSAKDYQFTDFYDTAPAIGTEAVCSIGNDVIFVRQGGAIALMSATQAYGNVFTSNLSTWIPNSTKDMNTINKIVYDVQRQRVYLFIPQKVLVLYKDLLAQDKYQVEGGVSPWSVFTTQHPNAFNTVEAEYMAIPGTSATQYGTIWGDDSGNLFLMDGSTGGDAGTYTVQAQRRSIHYMSPIVNPWPWTEENICGMIDYQRLAQTSATVTIDWDDEYNSSVSNMTLKGPISIDTGAYFGGNSYFGGTVYFGSGFSAIGRPSSINFEPGGKGPGFYVTITANNTQTFQIDQLIFNN